MRFIVITMLIYIASITSASAEWSGPGTISNLRLYNGYVILASLSSLSSTDGQSKCGNSDNPGQFGLDINQSYSNSVLSMLLSAEMAGRSVKVYMSGGCFENRPEINGIHVIDN
jgi:hypothetical protein